MQHHGVICKHWETDKINEFGCLALQNLFCCNRTVGVPQPSKKRNLACERRERESAKASDRARVGVEGFSPPLAPPKAEWIILTATAVPLHVAACTVANPPLPISGPNSTSDRAATKACQPSDTGGTTSQSKAFTAESDVDVELKSICMVWRRMRRRRMKHTAVVVRMKQAKPPTAPATAATDDESGEGEAAEGGGAKESDIVPIVKVKVVADKPKALATSLVALGPARNVSRVGCRAVTFAACTWNMTA